MDWRYWVVGGAIFFLAVWGLMMLLSPDKKAEEPTQKELKSAGHSRPVRWDKAYVRVDASERAATRRASSGGDDGFPGGYALGHLTGITSGQSPDSGRRDADKHDSRGNDQARDDDRSAGNSSDSGGGDGGGGGGD